MKAFLGRLGYLNVPVAADGTAVLDIIFKNPDSYDCVSFP